MHNILYVRYMQTVGLIEITNTPSKYLGLCIKMISGQCHISYNNDSQGMNQTGIYCQRIYLIVMITTSLCTICACKLMYCITKILKTFCILVPNKLPILWLFGPVTPLAPVRWQWRNHLLWVYLNMFWLSALQINQPMRHVIGGLHIICRW